MIANVTSKQRPIRYDAALQARVEVQQLEELRAAADELGVDLAVVIRSALRHGLRPGVRAIEKSISDAEADATLG